MHGVLRDTEDAITFYCIFSEAKGHSNVDNGEEKEYPYHLRATCKQALWLV